MHSVIFHVPLIQSTRCPDIDRHVHTKRRAAPYMYSRHRGRSTKPIFSTPSITTRGVPHSFDAMDRSDPHDSNSSSRASIPTSVSESDTAAFSVVSTTGKGGRASDSGFSLKKAGANLESILFKTVPDRFHSPQSIANQIRRLCRHDETTISQRHMLPTEHVLDAHKETLIFLCKKLFLMYCHK